MVVSAFCLGRRTLHVKEPASQSSGASGSPHQLEASARPDPQRLDTDTKQIQKKKEKTRRPSKGAKPAPRCYRERRCRVPNVCPLGRAPPRERSAQGEAHPQFDKGVLSAQLCMVPQRNNSIHDSTPTTTFSS